MSLLLAEYVGPRPAGEPTFLDDAGRAELAALDAAAYNVASVGGQATWATAPLAGVADYVALARIVLARAQERADETGVQRLSATTMQYFTWPVRVLLVNESEFTKTRVVDAIEVVLTAFVERYVVNFRPNVPEPIIRGVTLATDTYAERTTALLTGIDVRATLTQIVASVLLRAYMRHREYTTPWDVVKAIEENAQARSKASPFLVGVAAIVRPTLSETTANELLLNEFVRWVAPKVRAAPADREAEARDLYEAIRGRKIPPGASLSEAGEANEPPVETATFYIKPSASAAEIELLRRLAVLRRTRPTCTTYLVGYVVRDGRPLPVLADVGPSLEQLVGRPGAPPVRWAELRAALTCATAALHSLGYVHDDLAQGAARNITDSPADGYAVIDFGKMARVTADYDETIVVDGVLVNLLGWLVRNAPRFLTQSTAHLTAPAALVAALSPDDRRRYAALSVANDVAQPPPRRIKLTKERWQSFLDDDQLLL